MTGKEAWSIVAPIIASFGMMDAEKGELREAHVLVYHVLNKYDKENEVWKDEPKQA